MPDFNKEKDSKQINNRLFTLSSVYTIVNYIKDKVYTLYGDMKMKTKYVVKLHKYYGDADEYKFTTKEKRDKFLENLPKFYRENTNFISTDVITE